MGQSLEIKLPGIATDDTLRKLDEARFNLKVGGSGSDKATIRIRASAEDVVVKLVRNNGFLTTNINSTVGTQSLKLASGDNVIYVKLTAADELAIENSVHVSRIGSLDYTFFSTSINAPQIALDIDELIFFPNLSELNIRGTNAFGDIAVLKSIPFNLTVLNLSINPSLSGDIVNLPAMSNLRYLTLENTQISGSISLLTKYPLMYLLIIDNTLITGLFADMSTLTALNNLGTSTITGDLNNLPTSCVTMNITTPSGITFTGVGGLKFPILSQLRVANATLPSSQIDNLLRMASQATWQGALQFSARGVRTSSSDDAVALLQSKGVTVSIIL